MAKVSKRVSKKVARRDTGVVDGEKAVLVRITADTHRALMGLKQSCHLNSLNQAAIALIPFIGTAEKRIKGQKRRALTAKIARLQATL